MFHAAQALSLYRDASDLCRRALKRRPTSAGGDDNDDDDDDDAAYFRDSASLASVRAKTVEEALVASVERHLLAKNGLPLARYVALTHAHNSGGGRAGDGGEWLRTVLSRCSEPTPGRTDVEDVPAADAASASSTSSLAVSGQCFRARLVSK